MGIGTPLRILLPCLAALTSACASSRSRALVAPAAPAPSLSSDDDGRITISDREPYGTMEVPSWRRGEPMMPASSRWEGLFLYGQLTYGQILGDLDGDTAVVDNVTNPTKFVFLPDVDPSVGIGAAIGMRWSAWEALLGYSVTDYDASVSGLDTDTKMEYIDLLFRRYFWTDSHLQPFVVGGIGWSEAKIDSGSLDLTDPMNPIFARGRLNDGVTYNVGGGASFFLSSWLSVYGQALWRFAEHQSVSGTLGTVLTDGPVDTDTWEVSGGVSIRLLGARDRGELF